MKNIILRRNDTGETVELHGVTRLNTNSPDWFGVDWIEEDVSSRLKEITIERNGTYTAAAFGVYGISKAHVAVDFTKPTTVGNVSYQIQVDTTGKPHILLLRVK